MVDVDLLLEVGRQRHAERLKEAEDFRLARQIMGRTSSVPARLRWGAADALITLGRKLRTDGQPAGR